MSLTAQALHTDLITVGILASDGSGLSEIRISRIFAQSLDRIFGSLRVDKGRVSVESNGDVVEWLRTVSLPDAEFPSKLPELPEASPNTPAWPLSDCTFEIPPGCPSCAQLNVWPSDRVPAYAYLQGDIRAKRTAAKAANLAENVQALSAILPQPLSAKELSIGPGAAWLPADTIKSWICSLFPGIKWGVNVERLEGAGAWSVGCTNPQLEREDTSVRVADLSALDVIRHVVDGRMPAVWKRRVVYSESHRVRDHVATVQAQARVQELRAGFERWAADRPELSEIYERAMRGYAPWEGAVGTLEFEGMRGKGYHLYPYQLCGVWKILLGGTRDRSALLPYAPGRGKTDPAIAAAVKLWQLGRAIRTIIAVPSAVVGQWYERFVWLFPGLRGVISVVSEVGELAEGLRAERPFVILSHESLGRIPIEPAVFEAVQAERLREVQECLREAEHSGRAEGIQSARSVLRARERQLERLATEHLKAWEARPSGLPSWAELGCDHLVLDEFHAFKRLGFATRMENVQGLSQGESERASDVFVRCRSVMGQSGRVTALTGTPLTNTLAEAWIWMTFLQPNLLRHHGLQHFDAWASVFAEPFSSVELDAAGGFRTVTRLRFRNVSDLLAMLGDCWDFVGAREAEEMVRSGSQE